jgi:hypothetical protein
MNVSVATSELKNLSVASQVRRRVLRSSNRFWRADDFTGSRAAVLRELSRLAENGKLWHVRRGLYWRGTETMLGMSRPSSVDLVQELVGPDGVGPAEWSAALALGLSTQHPRHDIIAVPVRPPSAFDSRIVLKNRSGREGRAKQKLNWHEVALLEVLSDWSQLIELPREEAIKQVARLLQSDKVRPLRLARAARYEPAVVRESLRGLMSISGLHEEAAQIQPALTESARLQALVVV